MRNIICSLLLLLPVTFVSCNDDDVIIESAPSARGVVTDNMGNTYNWVRIGNLEWTTSNALNGEDMCYVQYYNGWKMADLFSNSAKESLNTEYKPVYGNLMALEDAIASAPSEDGWRLPSDEDWKALERALGMTDADNVGWRGDGVASRLRDKNGVEMSLGLGGIIRSTKQGSDASSTLAYDSTGECGYYWSSTTTTVTTNGETVAYFRKLNHGVNSVERRAASMDCYMSVRWCRNATND